MNPQFQWSKAYELGCDSIDQQHQYLFSLGNQLKHVDVEASKVLIQILLQYCRVHFKQEEQHMVLSGYPELFSHQKLHKDILRDLKNMARNGIEDEKSLAKLRTFFLNWLSVHVLQDDLRYVTYYHSSQNLSKKDSY